MKHFRIKNENALYDFLISSDIKEFKSYIARHKHKKSRKNS